MRLAVFLLLAAALVGTLPACARDQHQSIRVGDAVRTYDIHRSAASEAKSSPLLIVLHGALGSASSAKLDTGMSRRADKHGFITVYPQGTPMLAHGFRTWNAGSCCGSAARKNVDDIAFIKALIDHLEAEFNIDRRRIYICGLSNGGMLAYRLAAELSDKIAAVASVEGAFVTPSPSTAKAPVSVIAFHSTRDRVLPYNGGTGSLFGYKVKCLPVSAAISFWVKEDGCSPEPAEEREDGLRKQTYRSGKNGTEVCLYTSPFGHSWPVLRTWLSPIHRKRAPAAIICEFFDKHPKRDDASAANVGSF